MPEVGEHVQLDSAALEVTKVSEARVEELRRPGRPAGPQARRTDGTCGPTAGPS